MGRNKEEKCCEDMIKAIKKEMRYKYIILILVISGVMVFTGKTCCNDNFVNQISFAATVSSIILSVLAIIMSISGSNKMYYEIQRLGELREEINEAADNLKIANDSIGKISEMIVDKKSGDISNTTSINDKEE